MRPCSDHVVRTLASLFPAETQQRFQFDGIVLRAVAPGARRDSVGNLAMAEMRA